MVLKKFKIAIGRLEYSQVSNLKSSRCGVPTVWCETHSGNYWNDSRGHLISGDSLLAGFVMGCADSLRQKAQHLQSLLTELHLVQRREDPQRANKPPISCSSEELLLIVLRFIWSHIQRWVLANRCVFRKGGVVVATRLKLNPLLSFLLQKKTQALNFTFSQAMVSLFFL